MTTEWVNPRWVPRDKVLIVDLEEPGMITDITFSTIGCWSYRVVRWQDGERRYDVFEDYELDDLRGNS